MSKKKKKKPVINQMQPKEFSPISHRVAHEISDKCKDIEWAYDFLRMMNGKSGYAFNIRYLMGQHEGGAVCEEDMVHLCRAVRHSYGMVLNPL